MAEEGTLGLARAEEAGGPELSKEELQRRMGEARESISQTVADIKDNVVHQYESVKETISDTLDWREQFKKRPLAWTAGAAGAGFLTGYCVTAMVKGDGHEGYVKGYEQARQEYLNNHQTPARSNSGAQSLTAGVPPQATKAEDSEPGLIERIQETQAFDHLKNEAASIGGHLVDEVSKTAKEILVPAAVGFVRHWLEGLVPKKSVNAQPQTPATNIPASRSSYQPVTERQPVGE